MPWYAIVAAIVVSICWGGNFSAARFSMMDFPPFLAIFLRFVLVSLLLAPLALRQARPDMRDMAFLAVTNILLHFSLLFLSVYLGLNLTSVVIATQLGVPFSCLFAAMVYKDHLGPWRSFGMAVAFLGVLIIAGTPNATEHSGPFLIAVAGAVAWAVVNIYLKRLPLVPWSALLFWPALLSLPMLLAISLLFESNQLQLLQDAHVRGWLGIAYSTIFSSLLGYGLWNWLATRFPLSQSTPYLLLAPIVGIGGGVFFFDEPVTWKILTGAALTIAGVGVITLRRPKLAELEKM